MEDKITNTTNEEIILIRLSNIQNILLNIQNILLNALNKQEEREGVFKNK